MNPSPDQAIEDARRAGFDLGLLESNLALTPSERAARHDSALELAQALRKAGEQLHAQPAPAVAAVR